MQGHPTARRPARPRDRGAPTVTRRLATWRNKLAHALGTATRPIAPVLEGLVSALRGNSPLWTALKVAAAQMSPQAKAVLVLSLVAGLLLAPVLLVLLVLGLVVAGVAAVRVTSRS